MNYIYNNKDEMNELQNRFVRYVKIWSESDENAADSGLMPSTPQQWDMAKILVEDLKSAGAAEVILTDFCYVVAKFNANIEDDKLEKYPSILLMAHMDTVDEVSGKNVNPVITFFEKADSPTGEMDTIIKSDGNTLLGADDKAGISAIITALEYLKNHSEINHGPIEVMFSPDEETGHGMDKVPLDLLLSKCAYTVDGGDEGEMETECFNAWAATVTFTGKACHTGDAKANGMINAVTMAGEFTARLPHDMAPETTENYQGFIAPMETGGTIESAYVKMLLRSFNIEEIKKEKSIISEITDKVCAEFGGTADVQFKQQYLNMKEKMDQNPQVVANLEKAYESSGVKIVRKPIRGGTDGSRLTELGIPTPNIFTGAHEFHSRNEWCSLNQMSKAADVLINLIIGEK